MNENRENLARDKGDTLSEMEIIKRIKDGETGLFEILIRRNNPYLYRIGRSYGYGHHDTEDLMQEAFIAAYMNLIEFEQRSSFKTWITRIMINKCFHKAQKLSFKKEHVMHTDLHENTIPAFQDSFSSDTGRTVLNREMGQMIESALLQIPLEYKMVFSLRELNGMSTADTADALDITESNVKVRLTRAKRMLRQKIEKMYSPTEIFEFNLIYCNRIVENVMNAIKDHNTLLQ
jgi:RNA polymerase sigma-70 factor (ECF subfamily)